MKIRTAHWWLRTHIWLGVSWGFGRNISNWDEENVLDIWIYLPFQQILFSFYFNRKPEQRNKRGKL